MKQNNSGMSMILVIAALLATGFIGSSLLKMAMADRLSGVHFSSSESARSAAKSGITAALVRIGSSKQETKDSILAILNNYIKTPKPDTLSNATNYKKIWINGGPNSAPTNQQWQSLASGSAEKFRTRIDAFNRTTFEITLVSEGIGAGGSKSSAIGVYRLTNLGITTTPLNVPLNAIQMDNGNFELNVNLTVEGNTCIKGSWTHNSGTFVCTSGVFRQDPPLSGGGLGGLKFNTASRLCSTAYFAGACTSFSTLTLRKSAGFGGQLNFGAADLDFYGSRLYLNGGGKLDAGDGGRADLRNAKVGYYSTATYSNTDGSGISRLFAATTYTDSVSNTLMNIPALLGLSSTPAPEITMDTASIAAKVSKTVVFGVSKGGTITHDQPITVDSLTAWYNATTAATRYGNVFAVVRIKGTCSYGRMFNHDAAKSFAGKMILLVEDGNALTGDYVQTTNTANLSVYIKGGSSTVEHFTKSTYSRGFIYINSSSANFAIGPDVTTRFQGAIYAARGAKLYMTKSGTTTITYDSGVLNELGIAGAFGTSSSGSDITITSGSRIVPVILSHAM